MVGKYHAVIGATSGRRSVHVAVEEVIICRAEGGFDVIVKLWKDVWNDIGIGVVV
jgi:hypothetical protein